MYGVNLIKFQTSLRATYQTLVSEMVYYKFCLMTGLKSSTFPPILYASAVNRIHKRKERFFSILTYWLLKGRFALYLDRKFDGFTPTAWV